MSQANHFALECRSTEVITKAHLAVTSQPMNDLCEETYAGFVPRNMDRHSKTVCLYCAHDRNKCNHGNRHRSLGFVLHNWFRVNKLSLNVNNTRFMIFGKKERTIPGISININQGNIERVY